MGAENNRPVDAYTIIVLALIALLVAVLPIWSYSRRWGYYPGGAIGLIVLIVVIFLLIGKS